MVLALKDTEHGHVKILTLSHEEVETVRAQTNTIIEAIAEDYKAILANKDAKTVGFLLLSLSDEPYGYINQETYDAKKVPPHNIRKTLCELGLTMEDTAYIVAQLTPKIENKPSLEHFKKIVEQALVSKALKAKIAFSDLVDTSKGKPTVAALVEHAINRKKAYLDTWTELMAGQNPPFDARQQFRDEVKMTGWLVTDSTFFIPDQIEGIPVHLGSTAVPLQIRPYGKSPEEYTHERGFLEHPYKDAEGEKIVLLADAYTVDHRLVEAMEKTGRKRLLKGFESIATFSNHDTLHGAIITPLEGTQNSPFYYWNRGESESYKSFKALESNMTVEVHAAQTHRLIMKTLLHKHPAMQAAAIKHAAEYAHTLSDWQQSLVQSGKTADIAHNMAASMAHQAIQRMTCNWNLDDPIYTTKLDSEGGKTLAELYGQFASKNPWPGLIENAIIKKELPHFVKAFFPNGLEDDRILRRVAIPYPGWQNFVLEHLRDSEHRNQMRFYEIEKELKDKPGPFASVHDYSSTWQKVLLSTHRELDTTSDAMLARHQSGKHKVLLERAKRDELRRDLQLDTLLGDTGLIAQLEQALPEGTGLRKAIDTFKTQAKQASVTIENRGQLYRPNPGRNETELPIAIEHLGMYLDQIPAGGPLGELARDIMGKLATMHVNLQRAAAESALYSSASLN